MMGAPASGGDIPSWRAIDPARVLVLAFAGAIVVGTFLLMLPLAAAPGVTITWSDALFTAASAVCVTGLTVIDTASSWTFFGQAVILVLIHVGGLGLMTMSTLVALILGKRITLRERLLISSAMHQISLSGVVRLTRNVLITTATLEGVVALILAWRWSAFYDAGTALWLGVFHAGSAFNSAGFDLFGDGLAGHAADLVVLGPIAFLILCGGLGFSVLAELARWFRSRSPWRELTLHTKAVVTATSVLVFSATATLLLLESSNPHTLQPLSPGAKLTTALFTAVSSRTAGYDIIPTAHMTAPSLLFIALLMFIGGSPGSTAGGIKTTTAITVLAAVKSTLAGQEDVVLFRRRLDRGVTDRALALGVVAVLVVGTFIMLLLWFEGAPLLPTLFEATSALGTTGLSVGLTPQLSIPGRLLLVLAMFIGRVGPLTLAFALARRHRAALAFRYPEDRLMIG